MIRLILAVALMAIVSTTAKANLIYNLDFDTTTQAGSFTTGGTFPLSFVNSSGVGGTNGGELTFDTTNANPFSVGIFADIDVANNPMLSTPTSIDLSDYVLTFDVQAGGFEPGFNSIGGQVQFAVDGMNFVSGGLGNGSFTATDQFQTISINLGPGTVDPAVFSAANGRPAFTVSLLGVSNGGSQTFGSDAGNTLVIDNLSITELVTQPVPEPGSLVLLATGMIGFAVRRRR